MKFQGFKDQAAKCQTVSIRTSYACQVYIQNWAINLDGPAVKIVGRAYSRREVQMCKKGGPLPPTQKTQKTKNKKTNSTQRPCHSVTFQLERLVCGLRFMADVHWVVNCKTCLHLNPHTKCSNSKIATHNLNLKKKKQIFEGFWLVVRPHDYVV